jgi:hypothetical protein
MREAEKHETTRLNTKRRDRVQAKAFAKSKSDDDGEEGEEGDEDVVAVNDEAPPKKRVYRFRCWINFKKPKKFADGDIYVVCKL